MQCLSVDTVVEGVHFTAETGLEKIGYKAAAAALSDLAAMGAEVVGAAVSLQCPTGRDPDRLMAGLVSCLETYKCPLLGGDTVSSSTLALSVTVWGQAAGHGRLLRRDGGTPGDLLIVTGALGGSFASGRHLRPTPRLREGAWLAAQPAVTAMMDISDGLAQDVHRFAAASSCGALLIPENIPVHDDVPAGYERIKAAACDGEDFELLFAVNAGDWPRLQLNWAFDTPLYNVGWLLGDLGLYQERDRRIIPLDWAGYEHDI